MVTLKAKVVQMRFATWTQRNVIEFTHFQDASFATKSMSTVLFNHAGRNN